MTRKKTNAIQLHNKILSNNFKKLKPSNGRGKGTNLKYEYL